MFGDIDFDNADKACEAIIAQASQFWKDAQVENARHYYQLKFDDAFRSSPVFLPKRKKALEAKGNRAFTLLMRDVENLKLDEKKYPLTAKTIKAGDLPISTFFKKSEQYFLFNDNWSLWEQMLKKYHEQAIEIAKEAASRTHYEKDLMSYFYFVLHRLPEYLKKYTKQKWTCIPKLVSDTNELEAPEADATGTSRQRSALTPIVDNEKKTVVVPYTSLKVPGVQTTYCYGLDFNVLTEGQSFDGNVVVNEIEEKLNGKDDYGLMYYTLTGSAQGRGYPTFLIIFERLQNKTTMVHFHRTHPFRSKNGDYNPIHNWIKGCYNWMAGNVNFDRIKAQQGDLMFVETDTSNITFETTVNEYDSHRFNTPVLFAPYTKCLLPIPKRKAATSLATFRSNMIHCSNTLSMIL